jgi:hypothetical protein
MKTSGVPPIIFPLLFMSILGCNLPLLTGGVEREGGIPGGDPGETPEPAPEPVLIPAFTVGEVEVLVTRRERDALGLHFWPDLGISVLPGSEGRHLFFGANGDATSRSVGPLEDPLERLDSGGMRIQGIDPSYTYASAGAVYRDAESGAILMFYHAEIEAGPERTYGDYSRFYSLHGMAISRDDGFSFQNLGEITRPEWKQGDPTDGSLIIAMAGGTVTIKNGHFYFYFNDFPAEGGVHNLCVARAPVDEVVRAALEGRVVEWKKYYNGDFSEPGLGGKTSPLEVGNPGAAWMGVSFNNFLDAFVMAIATYEGPESNEVLYLTVSPDGIHWSPRVDLARDNHENQYPAIVGLEGSSLFSGESFYVYNTHSAFGGVRRWEDATLVRRLVTLKGMVEPQQRWDFDAEGQNEGWVPQNHLEDFTVSGGTLGTRSLGDDPYMGSPAMAVQADLYPILNIRMKVSDGNTGQIFFITDSDPLWGEAKSLRFDLGGHRDFQTYTLDMSNLDGWKDMVLNIRLDPTDAENAQVEIDWIEFTGAEP